MSRHSIQEAGTQLAALVERAIAGEDVVLTKDGKPVVELRAVPAAPAYYNPPHWHTKAEMLDWLAKGRVGQANPSQDAASLIREMREEGEL